MSTKVVRWRVRGMMDVDYLVDTAQSWKLRIMTWVTFRRCCANVVDHLFVDDAMRIIADYIGGLSGVLTVLRNCATNIISVGSGKLEKMVNHMMRSFVCSTAAINVWLTSSCHLWLIPRADNSFFNERVNVLELSIVSCFCFKENVLSRLIKFWSVVAIVLEATTPDI